jgi:hypothetical protein
MTGLSAARVHSMFAVTAARIDAAGPLAGLGLGGRPDPSPPAGWTTVTVRATALNHHDVWTLRGVGISAGGDETPDPSRSLPSERYDGTFAQRAAPARPDCTFPYANCSANSPESRKQSCSTRATGAAPRAHRMPTETTTIQDKLTGIFSLGRYAPRR